MMTQFNLDIDFSKEVKAITIEKSDVVSAGGKIKVYIPTIMSGITQGDPCISNVNTNGSSVFKNMRGNKPALTSNTVIKAKNYLEAKLKNNSDTKSITKVVKSSVPGGKDLKFIPKGSTVRCNFLNQKLSELYFNTDVSSMG